ncbi:hypothetical protein SUGI_1006680 [Cryptomeria japonica]|uniref:putative glucuronosyltransferase PGSIP8 n=1 Tax=Cryptomeria japonica TaxID=3369 RepID=UPI0024149DD2|nr:putative glucuronosyltransferase PGSIP8 [Cryptomeria japonica]XP_057837405.2 putative glucuronosyltransferase PGSIP8 [Cryptomeria japonica]XP_057837406.2 putative glucuronosyltransferase PGSIP8 [Cryptomeria japonica]XP_057837407.2 putative glucuronosyltransferase PGSIP8 [Cryptomeria japonica]XP_057837409.2 putative glucuronosyltransferase PGSIP8 [Cryptomeria japonica]XP_059068141.1 putative glucuronosyltransferase PGSIP8 [Cryptomeria japonica]GLJ47661.1 hypothetical protein SUGI_1006680 [C
MDRMSAQMARLAFCIFLVAGICFSGANGAASPAKQSSKNAYATMMYMGTPRDYEFYVAIRVMLLSLIRLKVDADLLVIASKDVPQNWIRTLHEDGVIVKSVENIENPYSYRQGFNKRFTLTLNKLYAWTLVDYERVVMLDADNLFLQNTDELFQCGQFCATFINPCLFHTGLFVLQPSEKVFRRMLHEVSSLRSNRDGADQGFLVSYFDDLLDRPMFHPPVNGSKLDGLYRLPLGYQMDASYFYLKLKWRVPCGPNSVITFPSAPWLKPWYWWSWPVLPLGLSWHEQRFQTIGYGAEMPLILLESLFYLVTMAVSIIAFKGFHPSLSKLCLMKPEQGFLLYPNSLKLLVLTCMVGSYLLPFFLVPRTVHPVIGWGLYLLGSMSFGVVLKNAFLLPALPLFTPWLGIFGSLIAMAFPFYSNGIVRALSVGAYAFLAAPFVWWALTKVMSALDTLVEREALRVWGAGASSKFEPQSLLMKVC